MADDAYFFTDHRWQQLLKAREEDVVELDHTRDEQKILEESSEHAPAANPRSEIHDPKSLGTVGAVACDINGDLAAATSTGGMTNKKFGRVGDTPLIGAGTYADNSTCAVSGTGHGEFFMLGVTAYDVAARIKYRGLTLKEAAQGSLDYLTTLGGEGGLIAVDARGNVALPFNCEGMYRGYISDKGETVVEIYR
jgi:beta-aspartyl-peptidase (threonine type)